MYKIERIDNEIINVATKKRIKDKKTLHFIKSLRIPPAYHNVHISHDVNSKILAYGYDTKDRKQVIYNKWFIEQQQNNKFQRVNELEPVFNRINRHIKKKLLESIAKNTIDKNALICLLLRIMMLCNFRIGNDKYTKEYCSYGLTTLEWQHILPYKDDKIIISFIGKKGVKNESILSDKHVIKLLRTHYVNKHYINKFNCRVFEYEIIHKDGSANIHSISAKDVNDYLQKFDDNITCKDIRTWRANCLYMQYYKQSKIENERKRQIETIKKVALELHNTPTVCKKDYISPELLEG